MKIEEFELELNEKMRQIGIILEKEQIKKFYEYMNLIIEWNKKINLTAIIEPKDIIIKHFVDCATISKYVKGDVIDIGTGAGFPGVPISIINTKNNIILMDSLNKRINFLNEVIQQISLNNVNTIHSRAEDLAVKKEHREKYNVVVSRAVAPLNVLLEYMIPFCKVGGICVCMKGSNFEEELEISKKALKVLGGEIEKIEEILLPQTDIKRSIIVVKKVKNTDKRFPRKAGKPSKEPIQ